MKKATVGQANLSFYAYFLSCINFDASNYDAQSNTPAKVFFSEYGWCVEQRGLMNACKDYLQGLPSWLNHEFYTFEIIKLFESGVLLCVTDSILANDDKLEIYYWNELALAMARYTRKESEK